MIASFFPQLDGRSFFCLNILGIQFSASVVLNYYFRAESSRIWRSRSAVAFSLAAARQASL